MRRYLPPQLRMICFVSLPQLRVMFSQWVKVRRKHDMFDAFRRRAPRSTGIFFFLERRGQSIPGALFTVVLGMAFWFCVYPQYRMFTPMIGGNVARKIGWSWEVLERGQSTCLCVTGWKHICAGFGRCSEWAIRMPELPELVVGCMGGRNGQSTIDVAVQIGQSPSVDAGWRMND